MKETQVTGLKKKISQLEVKLNKKNEVVSELMEELICLKKIPGEI
jgi:predicted RNase H-like nuclease (RuvC/YqgF family)